MNIWIIIVLFISSLTFADTLRDEFKQAYATNVNAMIALSSDDHMGAGRYKLSDNETLKIYHLPLKYNFNPIYKDLNIYVNGTISRGEVDDPLGFRTSLNMYKLGFGLRYKPQEHFYFSMGYSLIYSVYKSTVNYSKFVGTIFYDKLKENDDLLNSSQHNWTSEFIISSQYEYEIYEFLPYIFGEYKFYDTRTDLKLDHTYKVSAQDSIMRFKVGSYSPSILKIKDNDIKLEGFYGRTYYDGDMAESIDTKVYDVYGFGLHLFSTNKESMFKSVGIISEWTDSENFNGYNIGLTMDINF